LSEMHDFDFAPGDGPSPPSGGRGGSPAALIAGGIALLAALGAVGYFTLRPAPKPSPTPQPTAAVAPSPTPFTIPSGLPAIDESDAFVRDLAKALSSHPQLALWLGAKELVRTFTVVVDNVAEGASPAKHLGFLAPTKPFTVVNKGNRQTIDPRSYARYDGFAEGVVSLDSAGCGRVYKTLEPLLERAYRQLGYPQGGFTSRLGRAVDLLLDTPVVDGDVPVKTTRHGKTIVYEYMEPRLEALTLAQKHLLRMGPQNVRRLQAKLRDLKQALELPPAQR